MKAIYSFCGLALSFICPLMAETTAQGDGQELTFANADYEARFIKENIQTGVSYAWTLASLKYKDHDLIIESGANGAALQIKSEEPLPEGGFVGSRHGGEDIRRIVVLVDGTEYSLDEPFTVSGKNIELLKECEIGPYEHTSRIGLGDAGLRQEMTFKPVGDASNIEVFYPLMHCLSKSLGSWIVGSGEGLLSAGEFLEDDSFTNLGRLKWIGVFSGDDGYGAVISYAKNYEDRRESLHRFWNRLRDNKVYFWPRPPLGEEVRFVCRVAGFLADSENWNHNAEAVEVQLSKLP